MKKEEKKQLTPKEPKITVKIKDRDDVAKVSYADNIFAVLLTNEGDECHLRLLTECDGEVHTAFIGYLGILKLKKEFEGKYPEIVAKIQGKGDFEKIISDLEVK